jgi:hypothetical protein
MNSRLPGAAPQRFLLEGTQEDARGFSILERPLLLPLNEMRVKRQTTWEQ